MSDNLDSPPVTRWEGTRIVGPGKNSTTLNGIYTDDEIFQGGVHGPFNQTLFLGCSVVNFNVNLGWGAENSTLTVSLVNDDAPHWLGMTTTSTLNNFDLATYRNGATNRETFNTTERSPSQRMFPNVPNAGPNTSIDGSNPNNDGGTPYVANKITNSGPTADNKVSDFKTPNPTNNPSKELHMDLILSEKQRIQNDIATNAVLNTASPPRPDYGKVYYELNEDGSYTKKYWTQKDPGFVGEVFDILGCPVAFIFNDFSFAGIVTSWKNNGGQGGNKLYTVEIKSFASLLSNTQLIIDHYPGTVFTKFKNNPPAFDAVGGFGMPSNDIGNRYGLITETEYTNSDYFTDSDRYVGNIKQGNIPNVFNIYGYLETSLGFGKNDINEEGTPTRAIVSALKDLINHTNYDTRTPAYMDLRFSPYGRIVGKAPAVTKIAGDTYVSSLNPNIEFLKDLVHTEE